MADVTIPYAARAAFVPFHARTERDAVMVCHRRMGKTVAVVMDLILRCLANARRQPPPQYAFFYPTWKRAKDIAWPYLKYYATKVPGTVVREGDLSVEFVTGGKITLYGAANSRAVGLYLDGVVYDEVDEIPQSVVSEVSPALSDFGGWSVYAGMLKGRYNLWQRYQKAVGAPGHWTMLMRASESGIIAGDELRYQRARMGDAAYEMQYECNPNAAIANAIYGAQMDAMRRENRVRKLSVVSDQPINIFGDIGHSLKGDDCAFWCMQLDGRDILCLKYLARTGEIPAWYAQRFGEWEDRMRVRVACIYLPHDGTREDRSGKSWVDDLEAAGYRGRIRTVTRTPDVWNSINDVRAVLGRVYIDAEGCGEGWSPPGLDVGMEQCPSGLDCLDYYTKKVVKQSGLIGEEPDHNQYSHGADAFRTFVEAYGKGLVGGNSEYARPVRPGFGVMGEGVGEGGVRRITVNRGVVGSKRR